MSISSNKKKKPIVVPAGYNEELEELAKAPNIPNVLSWTDEQKEILRRYYPALGPRCKELAEAVSSPGMPVRSEEAIRCQARKLKVSWTGQSGPADEKKKKKG